MPHHLLLRRMNGTQERLTQGQAGLSKEAQRITRMGIGHPEGFIESFANIYADAADAILARQNGEAERSNGSLPGATDGVCGVRFVEAVMKSHEDGGRWIPRQFFSASRFFCAPELEPARVIGSSRYSALIKVLGRKRPVLCRVRAALSPRSDFCGIRQQTQKVIHASPEREHHAND